MNFLVGVGTIVVELEAQLAMTEAIQALYHKNT
jgi:hypothetical protein